MKINAQRWLDIDNEYFALIVGIDVDTYFSPINRQQEMDTFLDCYKTGRSYNPQFVYEEPPDLKVGQLRQFMASLDRGDPIQELYYQRTAARLGEIEVALNHDANLVTKFSLENFGRPGKKLLDIALNNVKTIEPEVKDPETPDLNAHQCAEICRRAMAEYGFEWAVTVIKELGVKCAVDNITREFLIREDASWTSEALKTIVVHEIGTHIVRAVNGYAQPLRIFGAGLPNYMLTEEGLAEYTEVQNKCFDPGTHRRISGRVLAADLSVDDSFWDVFHQLVVHFEPAQAFDIVTRVKLGIADTSQPGVFSKDYFYLEGLEQVSKYFSTRPVEDRRRLYAGKISMEAVPLVTTLIQEGYLREPKHLPEFLL